MLMNKDPDEIYLKYAFYPILEICDQPIKVKNYFRIKKLESEIKLN